MLNERDGPDLNAPTGDQPALVRLSEVVTETEDPVQAAKFADLFLLCMAAVGTVLGSLRRLWPLLSTIRWSTRANIRLDDRSPCLSGIRRYLWLRDRYGHPACKRPHSL